MINPAALVAAKVAGEGLAKAVAGGDPAAKQAAEATSDLLNLATAVRLADVSEASLGTDIPIPNVPNLKAGRSKADLPDF